MLLEGNVVPVSSDLKNILSIKVFFPSLTSLDDVPV